MFVTLMRLFPGAIRQHHCPNVCKIQNQECSQLQRRQPYEGCLLNEVVKKVCQCPDLSRKFTLFYNYVRATLTFSPLLELDKSLQLLVP